MSLQRGSGWGALARRERLARDEPALLTLGLSFDDDTLTPAQTPWASNFLSRAVSPIVRQISSPITLSLAAIGGHG
ncbi:MAG: hypothetical protein M5U34_36880 [Chloroflexi bacterium]|nr:hypothetical protein [Chloroflexota bacterium]